MALVFVLYYWNLLSVYITGWTRQCGCGFLLLPGIDWWRWCWWGREWQWVPSISDIYERQKIQTSLWGISFLKMPPSEGTGVGWCGRLCHASHKRITHIKLLYWIFSLCHPLLYNLCTSFTPPYLIIFVLYHFCVRAWFCIHLARSMSTADSLIVMILKMSEILWRRHQRKTWVPVTEYIPGSGKPHTFTLKVILVCKACLSLIESQFYMNQGVIWWDIPLAGYFIFMSRGE